MARPQFVMHSYTFRNYSLRHAYAAAQRFEWDAIELQRCHFDEADLENSLTAAIKLGGEFQIPVACVDFITDFINKERDIIDQNVRAVETMIRICADHGVPRLNGAIGTLGHHPTDYGKNGSALARGPHYERAAEALKAIGRRAAKHNMEIVLEIHMNTLHDTIKSTARLLDMVGLENVLANPDPGNMFSTSTAERDPEALDALKGRIGFVHLKNCAFRAGEYDYSVRLAEGHIDTFKWLRKLKTLGYKGPLCVEYCGEGDPHAAAKRDRRYLNDCLNLLK
jgi:3-dehydroshikimate dehydratase